MFDYICLYLLVGTVLAVSSQRVMNPLHGMSMVLFWPVYAVIGFFGAIVTGFRGGKK